MGTVMRENEAQKKTGAKKFGLKALLFWLILAGAGYYLVFFVINANFREVVANKVYRSAQPSPKHLRKWVERYGIKTVINLRGSSEKVIEQEQSTADELGLNLVSIHLSGKRLATSAEMAELIDALEKAETPVLLHCESGIDRSGMASALAAMFIGNIDYNKAKRQAYVTPGPWKRKDFSKRRADYIHNYAHISDIFKLYERHCKQEGLDTNNRQHFKYWATRLNPSEDSNTEYKFTCSYFPMFSEGKHFFPVRTLVRGAYIQFAAEAGIILFLAVFAYHKLSKKQVHKAMLDEKQR